MIIFKKLKKFLFFCSREIEWNLEVIIPTFIVICLGSGLRSVSDVKPRTPIYFITYFTVAAKNIFITICSCSLEIVWCTVTHSSSIYNEFRGVISLLCICKKTNFLLPLSSFSFLHNFFEQKNGKKIRLRVISSYCNSMVQ